MALTNEEMKKLAAEYGVPVTISNPPVLVKGEIVFLPGVKPSRKAELLQDVDGSGVVE